MIFTWDHIYKIHIFWRHFFSSLLLFFFIFCGCCLIFVGHWLCECSHLKDKEQKTQKCKKQKHTSTSSRNHKDRQVQNTTRQLMMLLFYTSLFMKCCIYDARKHRDNMGKNSCKWKGREKKNNREFATIIFAQFLLNRARLVCVWVCVCVGLCFCRDIIIWCMCYTC